MNPALFVPINRKWIDQALVYFKTPKNPILYFYTDTSLRKTKGFKTDKIYFKITGEKTVSYCADLKSISDEKPPDKFRLPGNAVEGKYYYGFNNIESLKNPLEIQNLKHFESGIKLRKDSPRPFIIEDIRI